MLYLRRWLMVLFFGNFYSGGIFFIFLNRVGYLCYMKGIFFYLDLQQGGFYVLNFVILLCNFLCLVVWCFFGEWCYIYLICLQKQSVFFFYCCIRKILIYVFFFFRYMYLFKFIQESFLFMWFCLVVQLGRLL